MKISRIWAIGNSHAWNFRKFSDSWVPQLVAENKEQIFARMKISRISRFREIYNQGNYLTNIHGLIRQGNIQPICV